MRIFDYRCDNCGKLKNQDANHWLVGVVAAHRTPEGTTQWSCAVRSWDDRLAKRKVTVHLCGDQCALLWQAKQMSKARGLRTTSSEEPEARPANLASGASAVPRGQTRAA